MPRFGGGPEDRTRPGPAWSEADAVSSRLTREIRIYLVGDELFRPPEDKMR